MTHLIEGQKAPPLTLSVADGKILSLEDFQEQTLILYFYPKDDTPGCTVEAQDFSLNKKAFQKHNAVVVGVSKDSERSHNIFCKKYQLNVLLASDPDAVVCQDYGVWKERNMYGKTFMGIERTTFVIADGLIKSIFKKVKVQGHAQAVLKSLESL